MNLWNNVHKINIKVNVLLLPGEALEVKVFVEVFSTGSNGSSGTIGTRKIDSNGSSGTVGTGKSIPTVPVEPLEPEKSIPMVPVEPLEPSKGSTVQEPASWFQEPRFHGTDHLWKKL